MYGIIIHCCQLNRRKTFSNFFKIPFITSFMVMTSHNDSVYKLEKIEDNSSISTGFDFQYEGTINKTFLYSSRLFKLTI